MEAKRTAARGRLRTTDEDELWRRVRKQCEKEFSKSIGQPWRSWEGYFARMLRHGPPRDEEGREVAWLANRAIEAEARNLGSRLRSLVKEAVGFSEGQDVRRLRVREALEGTSILLRATPRLKELLRELSPRRLRDLPVRRVREDRALIVHLLDQYNVFGLAPHDDSQSRFLTPREIAVVSLLSGSRMALGNGPAAYTVGDVIKLETATVRKLLKEHGWPVGRHLDCEIIRGRRERKS